GESGGVGGGERGQGAGQVAAGDIALLRTDWPRRTSVESERFWSHAPWTGRDACDWLVARGVKAVGYDYPPDYSVRTSIFSPETPVSRWECTTHAIFFPAGITWCGYPTNPDASCIPACQL